MQKYMQLSKRSQKIGDSPLRLLNGLVTEVEQKGIKVHRLNIGEPDEQPPAEVLQYFKNIDQKKIPYGPSSGLDELRKAWSEYLAGLGEKVDYENIIITTGASEALLFSLTAVADPGDEVVIFEPFYPNFASLAKILGIELKAIPFERNSGRLILPSSETIKNVISSRTRAILVDNPSNPTGVVYSKEELIRLSDIAQENNLALIVDEVYRELVYQRSHFSVLSLTEYSDRIIVTDSISKRFSLCGLRLGCVISRNEEIIKTIGRFAQSRLSAPLLSQESIIPTLKNADEYIKSLKESFAEKREIVKDGLSGLDKVEVIIPGGAFYAFIKAPIRNSEDFARWLLTEFSYESQTVLVAPGTGFYLQRESGLQEFRIAFVPSAEDLKNAVEVLRKGLEEYITT